MDKKAFIIIVTYNGVNWIEKCLKSTAGFPVIVIDNNSTDKTVEIIKEKFPEVELSCQDSNLGFGAANNIGISQAYKKGAEHFFLLNQDAYLEAQSLEKLIKIQKEHSDYGVISPIHLNGKGNRLDQYFSNYLNYKANPDFYSDFVLNKEKADIYEVPFVNAAGWLISRAAIEEVGGFDPLFFHYGEDDNYCQRLQYHNFKIGVVPNTYILHDREDRDVVNYLSRSNGSLKFMERQLKLRFANVNLDDISGLENQINSKKSQRNKNILKLKFEKASIIKKEIEMLLRLREDIIKSRKKNIQTGTNHLDI